METRHAERPAWEHYPHDADIGVRGFGGDPAEAFANAARAMTAALTPLADIARAETVRVRCDAPDLEMLFYDWLNAVIYEMATRQMLFADFRVQIADGRLEAELDGERVDIARHGAAVEPKGATLSDLSVTRGADGRWAAQCIVDV